MQNFLPLTQKDDTRVFANSLISEIIKIQCDIASTPYFGYTGGNHTVTEDQLRVCKRPGGDFLRQAEIRALNTRLRYVEETDEDENTYYGYVNSQGIWDGVGVLVFKAGDVFMSELLDHQFEGCGKMILDSKFEYWGQHKLWLKEGFGTSTEPDGEVYTGQWKEDSRHGYGVCVYPDGSRYQGEWRDDKREGQGFFKKPNGPETKGTWRDDELIN